MIGCTPYQRYNLKFGIKQSVTGDAVNKSRRKKPIKYIEKRTINVS